ncbi:hypothetical protein, partial [Corynebacterium sp. 5QC2CO]|uniref:hypothetical protein n=1 Tax=Corynebacterium sp. 5QC2CO TaxID=2968468 RepID=UPI00211C6AF6
ACVLLVGAGGLCLFWVLVCLRVMDCVAAPLFGCFSRGFFHLWERSWLFSSFFGLVGSEGENVLFLDNGQAAHFWCVVVVCFVFVRFLGLSLFFDSSDLKGF